MFQKDVPIVENIEIKPNNYLMTFRDAELAGKCRIGQFLEFKAGGLENLLRIPISIARVRGDLV
jgi:NAD(P)H-flavin reductase